MLWIRLKQNLHIEAQNPIIFSEKSMLHELWAAYKQEYLEPETFRTLDKQRSNVTTSEGQSYTMLRAVFQDDREVFDKSWQWTKDILQRREDHLFSWLFGEKDDGSYAVLADQGGYNTATDGDTDIALALIFAYGRWNDETYLNEAKSIIHDIWQQSVIGINGRPYLLANNLEKQSYNDLIVNPSYFAPYAYKVFAKVDTQHPWLDLVETSYEILTKVTEHNLDKPTTAILTPDWIYLNRETGEVVTSYPKAEVTSNYSYDAMRTPWRLALDWIWNQEPKAKAYLDKLNFLSTEWQNKGKLLAGYTHDGLPLNDYESHAMYGTAISYFLVTNPELANQIYEQKLAPLYSPDKQSWENKLSYYDDNWAWFGMALYNNELPNLSLNLN